MDVRNLKKVRNCKHCKQKLRFDNRSHYCSFLCCVKFGQYKIGECIRDNRVWIKSEKCAMHVKSATWLVDTGDYIVGTGILNTCFTDNCLNVKHMTLRKVIQQEEQERKILSGEISVARKTISFDLYVNGKRVDTTIESGEINNRFNVPGGMQRFTIQHKMDDGTSILLLAELPKKHLGKE